MALRTLLILILFSTVACESAQVVSELSQRQANEIISVLAESGIDGSVLRERGSKGRYSVAVPSSAYTAAVQLLHERGLPKEERLSFDELVKSQGFLSSSREIESLRLDNAESRELEQLLEAHASVLRAAVVLRTRGNGSTDGAASAPKASIVVARRPGMKLSSEDVKQIALNAVPGLTDQAILVSISESPGNEATTTEGIVLEQGKLKRMVLVPFLGLWKVPEQHYDGLALTLVGSLFIVATVGVLFGYLWGQYQTRGTGPDVDVLENPDSLKSLGVGRARNDGGE